MIQVGAYSDLPERMWDPLICPPYYHSRPHFHNFLSQSNTRRADRPREDAVAAPTSSREKAERSVPQKRARPPTLGQFCYMA